MKGKHKETESTRWRDEVEVFAEERWITRLKERAKN